MENNKIIKLFIIALFILFSNSCKAQQAQPNIATEIIGTWVAEDDPNVKWVFNTNNQCLDYYNNVLEDTYSYTISHQCDSETDVNTWFLKMIDLEDLSHRCYELYGANFENNNTLSIRDMISGKIFVYNKN